VTMHGWLPYYFIRLGINIFGRNEFGPRFFSVVFFSAFMAIFFVLVNHCYGRIPALVSLMCLSGMPVLLEYAIQARYYSYVLFFSILVVYLFMLFIEKQDRRNFTLYVVSMILIYYTHLSVFILFSLIFFLMILIFNRNLIRYILMSMLIEACFIFPHVIITKLPSLAMKIPARHSIDLTAAVMFYIFIERNILFLLCPIILVALMVHKLFNSPLSRDRNDYLDFFCILTVAVGLIFLSYMTPQASFYPRVFLPLAPFLVCASVSLIWKLKWRPWLSGLLAICLLSLLPLIVSPARAAKLRDLATGELRPSMFVTNASWVKGVIKHIDGRALKNPLILTSFEHFVFAYYSNYDVELIWPLRKDFIDSVHRPLFIILEDGLSLKQHCEIFLPTEKETCKDPRTMNFYNRLSGCTETFVSGVYVFECPPIYGPSKQTNRPAP